MLNGANLQENGEKEVNGSESKQTYTKTIYYVDEGGEWEKNASIEYNTLNNDAVAAHRFVFI